MIRPCTAAHASTAFSKLRSRASASLSRPRISARRTRRATAKSALPPQGATASSAEAAIRLTPTIESLIVPARATRFAMRPPIPPRPHIGRLMHEDVLLRPALEIKPDAMRQEFNAGTCQALASHAGHHCMESVAQRVQMEHVRCGIAKLLFGQGLRSPV